MKSVTEAEFDEELRRQGITLHERRRSIGRSFGMKDNEVADSIEEASAVVGSAWPGRIRGCVRAKCTECEAVVSLSPRSQRALATRSVPVLCMRCALRILGEQRADA